jgi:hypothetical protein
LWCGKDKSQFNGNIADIKWRSKGDDQKRSYGFTYDKVNRLMGGDFAQHSGSGYADNAIIDFDMLMGDGVNASQAYDANGNIKAMKQWGLKLAGSEVIDELSYHYEINGSTSTNKLKNVIDVNNDEQTVLGDFRSSQLYMTALNNTKTNQATDYTYDAIQYEVRCKKMT